MKIKGNKEKWVGRNVFLWGFIKGFLPNTAEQLAKYRGEGTIIPCIPGFAKSLGLGADQEAQLAAHAQAGEWEQFVETVVVIARAMK